MSEPKRLQDCKTEAEAIKWWQAADDGTQEEPVTDADVLHAVGQLYPELPPKGFAARLAEAARGLPPYHVNMQDHKDLVPQSSLNYPAEKPSSTPPAEV